jgi:hypothetical protein
MPKSKYSSIQVIYWIGECSKVKKESKMSNQKHEELDMNELTELTPFGLDVYNTRGNFPSSKIVDAGKALQSAKPLQPGNSQRDKAQSIYTHTKAQ